jgi:hypothetical protein
MALLGLLLAILLGGHAQQPQISLHHVVAVPGDTLGSTTGG